MCGLGVEIAKNTILQGPKQATIHDTKNSQKEDLATNFYLKQEELGLPRVECVRKKL